MDENKIGQNIDDKLAKVKYSPDSASHLSANQQKCLKCKGKYCTIVCPASVYEWDSAERSYWLNTKIVWNAELAELQCEKGAIEWKYPRASYGITYKNS
jgi:ferredoxin like protein